MQKSSEIKSTQIKQMQQAEALVTQHHYTIVFAAKKSGVDKDELRAWIAAKNVWRRADSDALTDAVSYLGEIETPTHQPIQPKHPKRFVCTNLTASEMPGRTQISTRPANPDEFANFRVF